jgi:septum formation protein
MGYDSILLASASERRSRLLAQIGVRHEIQATEIDETPCAGESAAAYVTRLAAAKARAAVEVLTAVALWHDGRLAEALATSHVLFRAIDAAECRRYWATGEPAGKAGGYAIQGFGAVFVRSLEGSFSNVMGLPLFETAALLDAAAVRRWQIP